MYSHLGAIPNTSYAHRGRMFGHTDARPGKVHALNGGPRQYTALCGETVAGEYEDHWTGDPITGHVRPATADARVTCKRCLKVLSSLPGGRR